MTVPCLVEPRKNQRWLENENHHRWIIVSRDGDTVVIKSPVTGRRRTLTVKKLQEKYRFHFV